MSETETSIVNSAMKIKSKIKLWVIFNVVLSFFLIVGQLLLLGSMQQLYSRMINIQNTHLDYIEKYKASVEKNEARKGSISK